jgi:ribosomal protein L37AE/L43A
MCPKCGGQGVEKLDAFPYHVCKDCGKMFLSKEAYQRREDALRTYDGKLK